MASKPNVSIRAVPSIDERFGDFVRWIVSEASSSSYLFGPWTPHPESRFGERWLALEAFCDDRSLGGLLAELHPDRTAQAVPPRLAAGQSRSTCLALLNRLTQELAGRGITLVTVYVSIQDERTASCLTSVGFRRTHDLLVLCAPTAGVGRPMDGHGWAIELRQKREQPSFVATFARTLAGTLDFPDLRIDAPIDRVLARFAESGHCGARRWYLLRQGPRPAGCLLLTDHADLDRCELQYMGLIPEFRGRGGGRWLAEYAVWQGRRLGRSHVITAVDAENDPAVAVYAAAVFDPVVRRRVYFRHLDAADGVSPCGL